MNYPWQKRMLLLAGMLHYTSAQAAVDSYRFMHVTISTPWYIFLFLLMGIFAPFVLMMILAWTSAARKSERNSAEAENKSSVE